MNQEEIEEIANDVVKYNFEKYTQDAWKEAMRLDYNGDEAYKFVINYILERILEFKKGFIEANSLEPKNKIAICDEPKGKDF